MPPLSLYIHMPWCIRKCPYCDFNSHKSPKTVPEDAYIDALIADLQADLLHYPARELVSIFIGGGTPSLFSAKSYQRLLSAVHSLLPFANGLEITLEANPGSVELQRFKEYRDVGINRLSLGIQSFNADHLKKLGRIHDGEEAHRAVEAARSAGFTNLNLDIMHGLVQQTCAQGVEDLQHALSYAPEHLSWYQLTIEPNTLFYKQKPTLPSEDEAYALETQGLALLEAHGYSRYEISAFAKPARQARHNMNYWLFGDYFGIGAGAHGKHTVDNHVVRTCKYKQPKDYLSATKPFLAAAQPVNPAELIFEFMLNASRLQQAIPLNWFTFSTGIDFNVLLPKLAVAQDKQLVVLTDTYWQVTALGRRFTNDLQALFLP